MVCIHCGHNTQVVNSRHQIRTNNVWRRRQCVNCGATFTTTESAAYGASWAVQSSSGAPTPFSRDKLFLSLYRSLQHRKTAVDDAAALTETVIKKVSASVTNGVIKAGAVTAAAQVALNRFDKAASIHYQAFHA